MVIPAFNAEKTIKACLASVIEQTHAPLEVFVIDDFSNDATEEAVRLCEGQFAAAEIRLVYFRLAQNAGPSVARNKGISMAQGSFIAFLDADDLWHTYKLAIIDRFANSSNAGLIYHSYTEKTEFYAETNNAGYDAKFLPIYQMLLRNPAATPCTVVRKQHALKFDQSMRYCEDYDLWLRIAECAPVLRIIGPPLTRLGRPPLTPGGLSGHILKMRIGEARVYYNFCRRSLLTRVWILPGLLILSLLKHLYSRICGWTRQT